MSVRYIYRRAAHSQTCEIIDTQKDLVVDKARNEARARLLVVRYNRGDADSCDLGVGCNETGLCYSEANGQPDRCGRIR